MPLLFRRFCLRLWRLSTSAAFAKFLGGAGVLVPAVRKWAGIGLIALLIAVFPANIYMLYKQWQEHGWTAFTWLLVARLPLQFAMIYWVRKVAGN